MNYCKSILICGGDKRQIYMYKMMLAEGFNVSTCALGTSGDVPISSAGNYDVVVFPVPVSTDGVFLNAPLSEGEIKLDDIFHTAPGNRNLSAVRRRRVDNLLHAVHIRRKCRDNDALSAVFKQRAEGRADRALTHRKAVALDVRAVRHKRQHALVAELAEARKVNHLADNRRCVNLEVARVHNRADRRFYRERDGICN